MTSQTNIHKKHIVVFTGAGISAESGLHTFRDPNGLWQQYSVQEVATPSAWKKDRKKVLDFYNLRRQQVRQAAPNAAHIALTTLQKHFKVSIITQNVDDLHERAGSKNVLHLHGEIMKARSTVNKNLIYDLGEKDIALGDKCEKGSQLRPHIVWFGESVPEFEQACKTVSQADLLLVIGTSLRVHPAASLIHFVAKETDIILVSPEMEYVASHITWLKNTATEEVPRFVESLI